MGSQAFNFDTDMAHPETRSLDASGNRSRPTTPRRRAEERKMTQYHGWSDQTLQPEYSRTTTSRW